jgi:NAD(P)-dependent dehydrogenase (short-subunit alcohol dehydrogenase family)
MPPRRSRLATGRKVVGLDADVSRASDITRLVDQADEALGGIDILVNNAGVNIRGASDALAEADWDTVIDTEPEGDRFLCARAFGPRMAARGWGRIVNLGSILSVIALPGRAPYAASKAGVANLTRVLGLEWAGPGVTVNAICPGPFGTEMNRPLLNDPEKYDRLRREDSRLGRWGELHEIQGRGGVSRLRRFPRSLPAVCSSSTAAGLPSKSGAP